jgi:hypothetical protein
MAAWVSVLPLTSLVQGVVTFQVIDRLLPVLKRKN